TTGSLTLSWVRRDAAKDAGVSPSRALTGLKAWIDADVLQPGEHEGEQDGAPEGELRFEALHAAPLPAPQDTRVLAHTVHAVTWAEIPPRDVLDADWSEVADFLGNPAVHAAKVHFGLKPYDALDFAEEERAASLFLDRRAD